MLDFFPAPPHQPKIDCVFKALLGAEDWIVLYTGLNEEMLDYTVMQIQARLLQANGN